MIPRVIHYFWDGGKKPRLIRKCIASWERVMPDCEIKEWNLARLKDEGLEIKIGFYEQALALGKWGFASDLVRWAVLEREGGIFLDADVELIRPLPEGAWLSAERDDPLLVNPGLGMAFPAGHSFAKAALEVYKPMMFDLNGMVSCASPHVITRMLDRDDVPRILPSKVMNPLGWSGGCLGSLSDECCAIHWYAGSWFNWRQRLVYKILPRLGIDAGKMIQWFRK